MPFEKKNSNISINISGRIYHLFLRQFSWSCFALNAINFFRVQHVTQKCLPVLGWKCLQEFCWLDHQAVVKLWLQRYRFMNCVHCSLKNGMMKKNTFHKHSCCVLMRDTWLYSSLSLSCLSAWMMWKFLVFTRLLQMRLESILFLWRAQNSWIWWVNSLSPKSYFWSDITAST